MVFVCWVAELLIILSSSNIQLLLYNTIVNYQSITIGDKKLTGNDFNSSLFTNED